MKEMTLFLMSQLSYGLVPFRKGCPRGGVVTFVKRVTLFLMGQLSCGLVPLRRGCPRDAGTGDVSNTPFFSMPTERFECIINTPPLCEAQGTPLQGRLIQV